MENTITIDSPDGKVNVRHFTGKMTPEDIKAIGEDLKTTCDDTIAGMPVNAGAAYEFEYGFYLIRRELPQ